MKRTLVSYSMLAGLSIFCLSQESEVRFHHFGVDEGLSHSLVLTIEEDSLGFLWFGTQDGINRFDGYQFRNYFKGETNRDPSDSWARSLYIDSYQQMWIWYNGTGLDRYDPYTETFHTYYADAEPGSISSTSYTPDDIMISSDFYEDIAGNLWIGTEKGLNRYNRETDSFVSYRYDKNDPSTLSEDHILAITGDSKGNLWIGTTNGLNCLDPLTGKVRRFMAREGSPYHLNDYMIRAVYIHPDGSVWVGTMRGGLNIINEPDSDHPLVTKLIDVPLNPNHVPSVFSFLHTSGGLMLIGSQHGLYTVAVEGDNYQATLIPETRGIKIFHLLEDSKGNIWVSSDDNVDTTLFRMGPDLGSVEAFHFEEWDPYVFNGGKVQFLHESRGGLLWIGTEKDGIYMVDLNARQFRTIDNYRERGLYISDNEVYSILEDDQRQLYVGTKTELNRIDLNNGSWYGFHNQFNLKRNLTYEYSRELPATLIGVLKMDHNGRIWVGSFDYKVSMYNPATGIFLNFHHNENDPYALPLWSLRSILVTRDDQVFFGAAGVGLCRLRPDGLSFETLPVVPTGDPGGINDDHVQYMIEDKEGILWLGTIDGGLNRYDPATGQFKHFVYDPSDEYSISNNRVKCILEPEIHGEDILWIGTNNGGLNRFDKISGRFTAFTVKDGFPSNTIHGILEDKVGNLWLSTNRGLVQFDPLTERVIVYTKEDGLVGNEFNEGAFFKNREGIMYFGGTNGVNYFDPGQIKEKPSYDIPVVITSMTLAGQPVLPNDTIHKRIVLDRSVSFTKEITLTHRDRFLSFEFTSLNFAAPNKIKYRYILDDFESAWNLADANQRYITYTNIPNGTYTLKLEGTTVDGYWSGNYTEVLINVLPPFWKRLWFKLTAVILFIIVILLIIQIRTRILKTQKKNLEKEVEERTHDLKEANRLLQLKQEEIVTQSEKISSQRDDLRDQNKKLELQKDEIQLMAEKLHESDQLKLKFFTNISHEFRTPLTLIMGPTEKLLNRCDFRDREAVKKELELMYRNERRLFKLINQLLEVRRVETGNLRLTVAEDDISRYLHEIYRLFTPYAEKKEIDFRFVSDPEAIRVHFDADKMEKIFYNLLSNAFKHTPKNGTITLSVKVRNEDNRDWLKVAVSDTGPGIPEEHLPYIFERFYQMNNKHQSGRISSGIGLSLSRDLAEKHYGRIEVISESGIGTSFIVYIPLKPDVYKPEEILVEPETDLNMEYLESMLETYDYVTQDHMDSIPRGAELFRVLVVEDNLDMQKFLYTELCGLYHVILAQNGEEGLLVSEGNIPDLIISDVMMPEMDGLEFCRRIKENELTSHIPVILLTAKTGEEDRISGFETGADDYITKPFNPDILKMKIRNILKGRKQLAKKFASETNYIPTNIKISQIDQGFLEKFIRLVEDNIDDTELSGDWLASELGMSKGNLYKKLKSLTGMTVNIFIRTIRLKVAARLLHQGKYNISEIAYAVGFNNPKYFSTCFSEMYSVSPKEYMKES